MSISLGLLGAGRIGITHARTLAAMAGARITAVHDPLTDNAEAVAALTGADIASVEDILSDKTIDGVIIATPTDLHVAQIEQAAAAGKTIFCEKPIDLDTARASACLDVVARAGVPLMIGFNRRFDPSFRRVKDIIASGAVGAIETVMITSRDPAPPPADYIRRSGGLFRDMMIHDFDMARFLVDEPILSVMAQGSSLVDPAIGAVGDVDTAAATLRTESGALVVITNSRRATYGYDQRIEVHGSGGMAAAGNPVKTTVSVASGEGYVTDPLNDFFMDRYAEAYRIELEVFCAVIRGESIDYPNGLDGVEALRLADAAARSLKSGSAEAVASEEPG